MQFITSIPGKLLFLAHELYKDRKISLKQKGLLKDLILEGSKEITNVYQLYLKEGTELTLTSNLLKIIRNEKENQSFDQSSESSYKAKQSIRARRNSMNIRNIIIPPKNIQKITNIQGRI